MDYLKPTPVLDPESAPFWKGALDGKLMVQRCPSTGKYLYPPVTFCPGDAAERPEWVRSSGRGTVFSWIVVRHPIPKSVYAEDVPYVVALIDLEEEFRMATNIIGCAPEDVFAGMPVQVEFKQVTTELSLPLFRPVASA